MFGLRWQPFGVTQSDWARWQHEMDRLLDRFTSGFPRRFTQATFPALNLWEDNDQLCVEAELPGFQLDQLEISVTGGNQLTIKGDRKAPEAAGSGVWHRRERTCGSFERTLELPRYVDADEVTAEFRQGVLRVSLPKREEAKPRRVTVKIA